MLATQPCQRCHMGHALRHALRILVSKLLAALFDMSRVRSLLHLLVYYLCGKQVFSHAQHVRHVHVIPSNDTNLAKLSCRPTCLPHAAPLMVTLETVARVDWQSATCRMIEFFCQASPTHHSPHSSGNALTHAMSLESVEPRPSLWLSSPSFTQTTRSSTCSLPHPPQSLDPSRENLTGACSNAKSPCRLVILIKHVRIEGEYKTRALFQARAAVSAFLHHNH